MNKIRFSIFILIILNLIACSESNKRVSDQSNQSDTSYAFKVTLDSFFKYNYNKLRHPAKDRRETYFENNPFKDSLIFLEDSIFSKYIPKDRYKLKILNEEQLCDLSYKLSKSKNWFPPSVLKVNYYYFQDSTYNVWIDQKSLMYTKDNNGNYRKDISGEYFSGEDTCVYLWASCGSEFHVNFIKGKDRFYVKK